LLARRNKTTTVSPVFVAESSYCGPSTAAVAFGPLAAGGEDMGQKATKHPVLNRGVAPDAFLNELVRWGKIAPEEIFVPNNTHDIYSNVFRVLGPWQGTGHRRAVMLEVMRVLAGFESSWRWNEGRDVTNASSVTPTTIEAGAWQVSANSMGFGQELRNLVQVRVGSLDGNAFQRAMKLDHELAMEYIARLLRRTVNHNGPVKRHEIDPWLRRDAVSEFLELLYPPSDAVFFKGHYIIPFRPLSDR
jgi:hypothetical protein